MSHGTKRSNRSATRRVGILAGPVVTLMCVPALAGPEGENVVAGKARFNRRGDVTTIRAADRTVINYSSFDIAGHETVRFIQPSETARVLNRIQSAEPTHIDGALLANGIVYFVNRAGVYFGQSAVVDVGQIYAAAGNITNRDFRAGIDHFSLSGEVVNRGTIRGEMVALLGNRVANFGSIVADEGTVIMASGQDVLIGERGGHVFARIEGANRADARGVAGPAGALENAGSITAENGEIVIGAGDIYALVLHDASRLRAETIHVEGGRGEITTVSGSLDASSADGVGGSVSILGERVALYGATVDASGSLGGGEVLIGGDFQGRGDVPTADRTFIDRATTIRADATTRGDGGKVIVWSDEITGFLGQISARGGAAGGAGGFVEVSGKQSLAFRGQVDLFSATGRHGTLLLDPDNIVIIDGGPGADDAEIADGEILAGDGGAVTFTISEEALEGLSGSILLQANDNITLNDLTDNVLDLASATGETVEFTADFDGNGTGAFTMLGADDTVSTQGADVTIIANSIALSTGTIDTTGGGGAGSVTLLSADGIIGGSITTGGGDISADANTDDAADAAALTINDDTTWDSGGGDIQIVAGGIVLGTGGAAQRLDAGAGSILVTHWNTATGVVSLGSTAGSGLHLSDAELAKITAADLIIGADGATTGLAAGLTLPTIIVRDANITNISNLITLNALSTGGTVSFSNVLSSDDSTFSSALTAVAASGINIQPNLTTAGDMRFEVAAGEITVGPQGGTSTPVLDSGGGSVTFDGATRVTNDGDVSILSGDGDVEFTSTLQGTAGGAVETITIDAGVGSLTIGGDTTGDGTTASATGLTDITLTNAGTTSIQGVDITGAFALTNALTGDFTTNGGAISVGTLTGLAGEAFSFGAVTITGGGFTIDNAGLLEIGGLFDLQGAFDQNSTAGTGTVELSDDIVVNALGDIDFASPLEVLAGFGGTLDAGADDIILGGGLTGTAIDVTLTGTTITLGGGVATDGGNLIVNGDTTLTGSFDLSTGTGVQAWNGSIDAGAFDTTFTTNGLDFNGGADSVSGTGALTIRPADEFTDLDVGDVAGAGGTPGSGLRFGLGDINAIGPGFSGIDFGFETIGEHAIQVGNVTGGNAFQSAVEFHAPAGAGSIAMLGNLFGVGFTFNGTGATMTIGGDINTGGGDLIINDSVIIDENADVSLITGGGLVQVTGTIGGTTGGGDESLTFDTGTGGVDLLDGLFGDSTLGQADATGLADIDFAGTGFVSVFEVAISGTFQTSDPAGLGGSFSTNGQSLEASDVDLAGVQFSFGAITTTSGGVTIDNSGVILFQGDIDLAGALDQNSTAGTGTVRFLTAADSIVAANADVTFESSVSVEVADTFFDAGTGGFTFDDAVALAANDTTFTGNRLDFGGGADSVTGTGTLTVRPADEFTDLDIGDIAGAGGTPGSGLRFGLGDIAAIAPGFTAVEFGFATIGEHAIQVAGLSGGNAFSNSMTLHAPAGAGVATFLNSLHLSDGSGATNENLTVNADAIVAANAEMRTGAAGVDVGFQSWNGAIDTGTFDTTFTGQGIDFNGGNDSVTGSGTLTIRPVNDTDDLDVGDIAGAGGTPGSGLRFGLGDFAAIAGGFSSVEFGWAGTGSHAVQVAGISGGNASDNSLVFHAPGGLITLLNDLALNDADLTVNGDALAAADLEVSTGTGGQSWNGALDASTFDAALSGNRIDFNGGDDSVTGSGVLTIRPADELTDLDIGNIAGAGGTPGSGLRFGLGDLDAIAAGFTRVEFGWATIGEHAIQVAGLSGGNAFDNAMILHAPTGAGNVSILNNLELNDASLAVLTGSATLGASLEIDTGTGGQTWTGDLAAGAFDVTFTGNRLDFTGGDDSVTGTGTLTIRPADEFTDLDVGDVAGAGGTPGSGLRFGLGDLAAIDGTFAGLEFGWAGIGEHAIQIAGVSGGNASANALTLHAPAAGGGVLFLNDLDLVNANLTVNGNAAFGSSLEVSTRTGVHNWNGLLALGGFDGILTGNGIDLNGGADSVGGSGTITLRPADEFTDIDVGNVAGAGGTPGGGLRFGQGDINALADGFDAIRFGYVGAGEHAIQIGIAAFTDSVEFHAPAGAGSILVLGPLTTGGVGVASVTIDGPSATTTLAGDITTNGGDILIDDNVIVAEGAAPTLTTNGGAISITGTTGGTTGGAAESLRLVASTGAVALGDDVYGNAATMAADASGLADFFIDSAGGVAMRALAISGQFTAGAASRIGTSFSTNGQALEAGVFDLTGTDFSLDDVTSTASGFTIDNSGGLVALGDFSLAGAFDQNDTVGTGLVSLGGDITTPDANVDFTSLVGLSTGGIEIAAGTAGVTFGDAFALNGFDATLTANRVDFNGGVGSVTGANGSLLIRPATDATDIDIGNVAGAGGTPGSGLRFGQGDLMALAGDFSLVEFGYETTGSHAIQIANSTFISPTIFHAPLGSITLLGTIAATGNGSLGFDSGSFIFGPGASIVTDGSDVLLPGDLILTDDASIATMGGDIFIDGTVNGDGNGPWSLSLLALLDDAGTVGLRDRVGGIEALNDLIIEGWDVRLTGIGTTGAQGVLGMTDVVAADDLRFRGNTYNANQQSYAAGDELRPELNTSFMSNGFDLSFLLATTAFVGDVDGFQGTLLLDGSNLSIATDGGNLTFERGIENDTGASGDADLDFDAGSGAIDIGGGVGAAIAVGMVDMLGSTISLTGVRSNNAQTFTADTIFVGGDHSTEVTSTGDILFDGDVVATADAIIRSAGAITDDIEITGTLNGAFDVSLFGGAGRVTLDDVVGAIDPLTGLTISGLTVFLSGVGSALTPGVAGALAVTALNDIIFTSGLYNANGQAYSAADEHRVTETTTFTSPTADGISFGGNGFVHLVSGSAFIVNSDLGDVTVGVEIFGDDGSEDVFVTAAGTASFQAIGSLANGGTPTTPTVDNIEITADEIDLNADVYGNTILLQAFSQGRDTEVAGGSDANRLDLTAAELAFLNDGFASITIGRADGTGTTVINDVSFSDPVVFRQGDASSVPEIALTRVIGDLTGTDDASFTFEGLGSTVELAGTIQTANQLVTFNPNVLVTADSTVDTDGGDITVEGTIDGPAGLSLLALVDDDSGGLVSIRNRIGTTTPLAFLTLEGSDVAFRAIGTSASAGILGEFSTTALDDNIINGFVIHVGSMTASAGDETRVARDGTLIRTTGGDVSLTDGQLVLFDGNSLTVESNGGDISVSGVVAVRSNTFNQQNEADVVLDADTGAITLSSNVGPTVPSRVGSLTATGATILVQSVNTLRDQVYNGDTSLNGDLDVSDAGGVAISGSTTLLREVTIATPGAAGDDILLGGTVDGGFDLTLGAGVDGNITIAGDVGGATPLGHLQIANANIVQTQGIIAQQLTQLAGTQSTTFDGDVVTDSTEGISLTGADFTANGAMTARGGGDIDVVGDDNTFNGLLNSELGGITILGDQIAVNAGASVAGDGLSITGSAITLNGLFTTLGEGAVAIANAVRLTVLPSAAFALSGDFTQSGAGDVLWGTPELVALDHTIEFNGGVLIQQTTKFRARNVTLNGSLDADTGADASNVNIGVGGVASIFGRVGGNNPFSSLNVNEFGLNASLAIGNDITTDGRQRFEPPTNITTDSTLTAGGALSFLRDLTLTGDLEAVSAGDASFFGPVDSGTSGPSNLSVRLSRDITPAATADVALAESLIRFFDDIGAGTALASIALNDVEGSRVASIRDGSFFGLSESEQRSQFPRAATITLGDGPGAPGDAVPDFTINADTITVGFFETLSVYANLFLIGETVTLADSNIMGSLNFDAPVLNFRARPQGSTLVPNEDTLPVSFAVVGNGGADLVVAGVSPSGGADGIDPDIITVVGSPTVNIQQLSVAGGDVGGAFFLGVPRGLATPPELSSLTARVPLEDFARGDFRAANGLDRDLDANGISLISPATIRAVAIAAAESLVDVPSETSPGTAARDRLGDLGITIEDADAETRFEALIGRALYEDIDPLAQSPIVTRNRVDFGLVDRVLQTYANAYSRPQIDEATGNEVLDESGRPVMVSRADDIRRELDIAIDAFFQNTGAQALDPIAFNSYLEQSLDHVEAAAFLDDLRELLRLVGLMGLSPAEYTYAKQTLLGRVLPQISYEEFEAIVDRRALEPATIEGSEG